MSTDRVTDAAVKAAREAIVCDGEPVGFYLDLSAKVAGDSEATRLYGDEILRAAIAAALPLIEPSQCTDPESFVANTVLMKNGPVRLSGSDEAVGQAFDVLRDSGNGYRKASEPSHAGATDALTLRLDSYNKDQRIRNRSETLHWLNQWRKLAGDAIDAIRANQSALPEVTDHGEFHGLDTADRVCFYEQDFYVLSNFSSFAVRWQGMDFPTSEHAYHWEKFRNPFDGESADDRFQRINLANSIWRAPSAHEAFKTAEYWKRMCRPDWDAVKFDVMRGILRAKVEQHEYVRRKLLATGERTLIENSWRDDVWGWGPNRDGQNMLGKIWMEIRAELRARLLGAKP